MLIRLSITFKADPNNVTGTDKEVTGGHEVVTSTAVTAQEGTQAEQIVTMPVPTSQPLSCGETHNNQQTSHIATALSQHPLGCDQKSRVRYHPTQGQHTVPPQPMPSPMTTSRPSTQQDDAMVDQTPTHSPSHGRPLNPHRLEPDVRPAEPETPKNLFHKLHRPKQAMYQTKASQSQAGPPEPQVEPSRTQADQKDDYQAALQAALAETNRTRIVPVQVGIGHSGVVSIRLSVAEEVSRHITRSRPQYSHLPRDTRQERKVYVAVARQALIRPIIDKFHEKLGKEYFLRYHAALKRYWADMLTRDELAQLIDPMLDEKECTRLHNIYISTLAALEQGNI